MSLHEYITGKEQKVQELQNQNDELKHQNEILLKALYASKSEKHKASPVADNQLSMFSELELEDEKLEEHTTQVKGYTKTKKKHKGRQALPEHLPLEEIVIEPDEDTAGMKKIGEQITEVLDYTPASFTRKRYIRPKYAMPEGGIVIADMPQRPLPKSIAEAGLLSYIIVNKFVDHLPFYRQIERFRREHKVPIPSSTINDWFVGVCALLDPLYNKLKEKVLDTNYLQADESPIKVMDKDKVGKTHQGYQWVYHNPLQNIILFNYRKGRGMQGPKELLSGYNGVLQCDGYSVYDKLAKQEDLTLAGCLAHVRRKYFEAKDNHPKLAMIALDIFSEIYRQEKIAKLETTNRLDYRKKHVLPLMFKLREWIEEEAIKVLPKSAIGKAMNYTIKQWNKLMNIFKFEYVELDNNLIENKIRPLALGRKNFLFAGSHKGAERIAKMYSFFATCKANEVNPYDWMKSTLEKIPNTSILDLEKLLPNNFQV